MDAREDLTKLAEEIRDTIRNGVNMMRRLDHASTLTVSQLATLNALVDGPVPMSLLAELKGVAQPTVSQHVSRLENWGLVCRKPNPEDRRVIMVEITEKGLATTLESNDRRNKALAVALERLSQEEQNCLREAVRCTRALATVLRDMRASCELPPPATAGD